MFPGTIALGLPVGLQTTESLEQGGWEKSEARPFTLVPDAWRLRGQLGPFDRDSYSRARQRLRGNGGHLQARCDGRRLDFVDTRYKAPPPRPHSCPYD